MCKLIKLAAILILVSFMLNCCQKIEPAGFWTDFHRDLLKEQYNDQGPWGGHRAIYWTSERQKSFDTKNVIDFAFKNGWTIVDSTDYTSDEIKAWTYLGKPIFPLSHEGFNSTMTPSIKTYMYFPRWTNSDVLVLRFKTGWISILPGTDKENEINGVVMLSKDRRENAVYHLWGE